MKIFVAGGTGVIGRRAVAQLLEAGHEVSVLARSDTKAAALRAAGATPVAASLFDAAALTEAVAGHDVVMNLATHIPPVSKAAKASAWHENDRIRTEGSRNLVDAALAAGASRYVQESIAFIYPDSGDRWIDEAVPHIDSPFTASVAAAEHAAQRFTEGGGVGVVLRFGQFYAAEAPHTQVMMKAARRGWMMLPGAPDAYAVEINADDAASAVVAALAVPPGIYNVADDEPLTRAEIAEVLAAVVGRKKLRMIPTFAQRLAAKKAPNMVTSQRVSNRAFKTASGWQPRYRSFRDAAPALLPRAEVNAGAARGARRRRSRPQARRCARGGLASRWASSR
jgi:nucleoside-diphosphate-sugar epimerase